MEPTAPLRVSSLGHLAATYQLSPATIREWLRRLSVGPVLTVNGVEHFDDEEAEWAIQVYNGRVPMPDPAPATGDQPE